MKRGAEAPHGQGTPCCAHRALQTGRLLRSLYPPPGPARQLGALCDGSCKITWNGNFPPVPRDPATMGTLQPRGPRGQVVALSAAAHSTVLDNQPPALRCIFSLHVAVKVFAVNSVRVWQQPVSCGLSSCRLPSAVCCLRSHGHRPHPPEGTSLRAHPCQRGAKRHLQDTVQIVPFP